jgi:hypothetical protein
MQSNRALGVGLLVLIVTAAAFAFWQFGRTAEPALVPTQAANAGQGQVAPAVGVVDENAKAGAPAPATADGIAERTAAPASAMIDESKPAIVGRVVGPDGQAIAGAKVVTAPGMGFANANGRMDFDTFDASDLAEFEDGDMARTMNTLREQLADRLEGTTDADGHFRVIAKGSSRAVGLRVLARGYAILDRRVERPSERDQDVGTLTLQQGAVVAGRVLDSSGAPIVGAQVSRVHEMETKWLGGVDIDMPEMGEIEMLRGGEATTTDANGRFELLHLAVGDLVLRARHPDHPVARTESTPLEAGRELRDVLITMQRGGEIRGTVLGMPADGKGLQVMAAKVPRADANPAAGMFGAFGGDMTEMLSDMGMPIGERNADIGADGKFVLRGLARESYRVWVGHKAPGFAGNSVCSAKVEAMPGGVIELRFEPGISVTFTVVDQKSGAPIERLWVRDQLRGGDGWADMMAMGVPKRAHAAQYPGGVVTVANLRPKAKQKLTLTVDATGYENLERADIELPKSGSLDLGRLTLVPTPVVQVTVVAADGGRAIANATVRIEDGSERSGRRQFGAFANLAGQGSSSPRTGKTDRDGHCTLNRPREGEAVIAVDAKDFAPFASAAVTFTESGPTTFSASLHVGGAVAVTVADTADKPVKDATVEHKAPDGDTATKKSDAQGLVHFDHLAPGTHSFRLAKDKGPMGMFMAGSRDSGEDVPWQTFEVVDRAAGALKLVKQPTAALRGVVRENGLPLAGARVSFREGTEENEADAATDAFGDMMGVVGGGANKRSAKTDEQGGYSLAELPEGQHRLSVTHKGRAVPAKFALTLRNGDNTFDIELDMTTVRGVVKDPQGQPLEGARVRVRKFVPKDDPSSDLQQGFGDAMEGMIPGMNLGGSTIKTDANGAFELRGVEPDVDLIVQATSKGFAPASGKVTAARGTTKDMSALQLGAAGKVKVTAPSDNPFSAVVATYVGEGDKVPPVTAMLRKGKGTLDGLRPGRWEISVPDITGRAGAANGGEEPPERKKIVEVVAGETIEVEL